MTIFVGQPWTDEGMYYAGDPARPDPGAGDVEYVGGMGRIIYRD